MAKLCIQNETWNFDVWLSSHFSHMRDRLYFISDLYQLQRTFQDQSHEFMCFAIMCVEQQCDAVYKSHYFAHIPLIVNLVAIAFGKISCTIHVGECAPEKKTKHEQSHVNLISHHKITIPW